MTKAPALAAEIGLETLTSRVALFYFGILVIALSACSTPKPALPQSADPSAVHEFLVAPNANAELERISDYKWPDDGAEPASYFDWIAAGAASDDPAIATRAGESAYAIADFLAEKRPEVQTLPRELAKTFGGALTPFQGAMVGIDEGTRGFGNLTKSGDYAAARAVFAAIATDDNAGARFVDSAYARAQSIAGDAALRTCGDRSAPRAPVAVAVRAAGELSGLAASVDAKIEDRRYAMDEVVHSMAAACLSTTNEVPRGQVGKFIENGVLMSPEAAKRLDPALEDYFQSQRDYLAAIGIDVTPFSNTYRDARG